MELSSLSTEWRSLLWQIHRLRETDLRQAAKYLPPELLAEFTRLWPAPIEANINRLVALAKVGMEVAAEKAKTTI